LGRYAYDVLKEERRILEANKVAAHKDCSTLMDLMTLYKKEIEETEEDIRQITKANEVTQTSYKYDTFDSQRIKAKREQTESELKEIARSHE